MDEFLRDVVILHHLSLEERVAAQVREVLGLLCYKQRRVNQAVGATGFSLGFTRWGPVLSRRCFVLGLEPEKNIA